MSKIAWILLFTNDYQKSKFFYTEKLGFIIEREAPDEDFCQFKLENCYLAIYGRQFVEELLGKKYINNPASAIYSFADVSDVDNTVMELKSRGVKFIKEPKTQPWGQRTAYFTDPDGHIWEIQKWVK